MNLPIDTATLLATFNVAQYDAILDRGLSNGLGSRDGQMCIEAAICTVLGLPHSDDPKCVADAVRRYKIVLNDSFQWPSGAERAKGLRDLGLAQLGSLGVVDDQEFLSRLAKKTIQRLIPKLFREVFPNDEECLEAANQCEKLGTAEVARKAADVAWKRYAATRAAASYAYDAANAADSATAYTATAAAAAAIYAATAAADAANAASYLHLSASLALEVLIELNSPGVALLNKRARELSRTK